MMCDSRLFQSHLNTRPVTKGTFIITVTQMSQVLLFGFTRTKCFPSHVYASDFLDVLCKERGLPSCSHKYHHRSKVSYSFLEGVKGPIPAPSLYFKYRSVFLLQLVQRTVPQIARWRALSLTVNFLSLLYLLATCHLGQIVRS